MQKEIRKTWFFNHPPQRVWECLTQPELLEQWLGATDLQPIPGHKFRFISPNGNHASCEVLEVVPFTRLSYSWQKRSANDDRLYDSRVVWTLTPSGGGTELLLVHSGFTTAKDLTGHDNGWDACLKKFAELLRTGH
ncbi:MAG: hypothetical protein BGO55_24265 [Sphingobacteriales bacterium 50-39]|nr:SRPBCC domain-containing protein [Sphingobacteriales bacterium]OJW58411.1 MAG: hypothetical protein BGO55_24265 [Sphingobacteriales bacterium 50-39]